eukprot:804886-Prorocentrum_minimum.AAC.3
MRVKTSRVRQTSTAHTTPLRAGMGFSDEELVNLAMLDDVVSVDADNHLVTIQAGARVSQVRLLMYYLLASVLHLHVSAKVTNGRSHTANTMVLSSFHYGMTRDGRTPPTWAGIAELCLHCRAADRRVRPITCTSAHLQWLPCDRTRTTALAHDSP